MKGKAYSHPAYGIGLEYNSETGKFDVKNTTESTWTESRLLLIFYIKILN